MDSVGGLLIADRRRPSREWQIARRIQILIGRIVRGQDAAEDHNELQSLQKERVARMMRTVGREQASMTSNSDAVCPECGAQEPDWNASRACPDSLRRENARLRGALKELYGAVSTETEHSADGGYGRCCICNAMAKATVALSASTEQAAEHPGAEDLVEVVAKALQIEAQTFRDPVYAYVEGEAIERWEAHHPDRYAHLDCPDVDWKLESWKILARGVLSAINR